MQFVPTLYEQKRREIRVTVLIMGAVVVAVGFYGAVAAGSRPFMGHLSVSSERNSAVIPDIPNTGAPQGTASVSSATGGSAATSALSKGMVSFDLDGGYESAYLNALPLFDKAGIKADFDIRPEYLGFGGYVNEAQLTYVKKRGHEVGEIAAKPSDDVLLVRSDTSFSDIKAAIDQARKEHRWLIIVIERVEEPKTRDGKSVSHELIQQSIDYVRTTGLRVVTHEMGLQLQEAGE